MDGPGVESIYPSVDWVTYTYKSSNYRSQVHTMANSLLQQEVSRGNRLHKSVFNAYQTISAGHILWGEREDGFLVRLSGETAAQYWLPFLVYANNCTRLDAAVTARLDVNPKGVIEQTYHETIVGLPEEQKRKYSLIQNSKGGATLYVGSRTSVQYGRFYNKHAESTKDEAYLNCVRYEVEFKKPLSFQVAYELQREENQPLFIRDYVHKWFLQRGVVPLYNSTNAINAIKPARKETDVERSLKWLATTVHPVFVRLCQLGLREMALDAIVNGTKSFTLKPNSNQKEIC